MKKGKPIARHRKEYNLFIGGENINLSLHIPPILPSHLKQRTSNLPE